MSSPTQPLPGTSIRQAEKSDLTRLAEIYRQGVMEVGPEQYTPEQVAAWSAFAAKTDKFRDFVLNPHTLVLEAGGEVIAFAGIEADGHIASLYVDAGKQRSGVGCTLLKKLEEHARDQEFGVIYAEASEFSKPLFLKNGFAVDREETVQYDDVLFLRYVVVKSLCDCG